MTSIVWNSGTGKRVAWRSCVSIALRLSPLAACKSPLLQVAVAAIRGWRSLSYQAEISRTSPTAIVMGMDQSASMNHRLKSGQSKDAFLADVLNKKLYTLITTCSKADGVRDYFHVGVVAYGGRGARHPRLWGHVRGA